MWFFLGTFHTFQLFVYHLKNILLLCGALFSSLLGQCREIACFIARELGGRIPLLSIFQKKRHKSSTIDP